MICGGRVYRFRAMHRLPGYPEPWCHEHEHDYRVEMVLAGTGNMEELDREWRSFAAALPHRLNAAFEDTTVEGLAAAFLSDFADQGVVQVKVWEDDARWGLATK